MHSTPRATLCSTRRPSWATIALICLLLGACGGRSAWQRPPADLLQAETPAQQQRLQRALHYAQTGFTAVDEHYGHLDTISVDPDTASYDLAAAELAVGRWPAPDGLRIEEFVNAFTYPYPAPNAGDPLPLAVETRVVPCPWARGQLLLRVGIQGEARAPDAAARRLVLLIDSSGSMRDRLDLLRGSLRLLLAALDPADQVAVIAYAREPRLLVPFVAAADASRIEQALRELHARGSTNGAAGLAAAYRLAAEHGAAAQVLLFSDGAFNCGSTAPHEIRDLVRRQSASGVHLTAVGLRAERRDDFLEQLTNIADGSYLQIDDLDAARRALVERLDAVTGVAAKDVKIQLFFNPEQVRAWKRVGYANRGLWHEDFNDDHADAGELGWGQQCSALYQIVPMQGSPSGRFVDPNPFVETADATPAPAAAGPLLRLRIRARRPQASHSELLERDVAATPQAPDPATAWASTVARFGLALAGQLPLDQRGWDELVTTAHEQRGPDPLGRRAEGIALIKAARDLWLSDSLAFFSGGSAP